MSCSLCGVAQALLSPIVNLELSSIKEFPKYNNESVLLGKGRSSSVFK
jgi:hypothetical protein